MVLNRIACAFRRRIALILLLGVLASAVAVHHLGPTSSMHKGAELCLAVLELAAVAVVVATPLGGTPRHQKPWTLAATPSRVQGPLDPSARDGPTGTVVLRL
jgi:hypothetical protein